MFDKFGHYISRLEFRKHRSNSSSNLRDFSPHAPSWVQSADKVIKRRTTDASGVEVASDVQLALLRPIVAYKPTKADVLINPPLSVLDQLSGPVALDIETTGVNAEDPTQRIVGIGLADASHIYYFDLFTVTNPRNIDLLFDWVRGYGPGFIVYNAMFESAWFHRYFQPVAGEVETIKHLNVVADVYGMYRQLAQEGYPDQKWGLKKAQIDLLGWEDAGDIELDEWLVAAGHVKVTKKPDKSKMYLAPAEILGYYCGLDCASTYQLWAEVMLPSIEGYPWKQRYLDYHDVFLDNVKLLAENQLTGIPVDKPEMERFNAWLLQEIVDIQAEFWALPEIAALLPDYAAENCKPLARKLAAEPPKQFKKNGEVSKNYLKHFEQIELLRSTAQPNLNSTDDLAWIFYTKLGYPILTETPAGKPGTGRSALPGWGTPGAKIKELKDTVKLQGYVEKCLSLLREYPLEGGKTEYRIHPHFIAPGTLTGRLAGSGGWNVQQLPKNPNYLACFRPEEGRAWVNLDFTSLENVVLAELTRDTSMMKLYGPSAPPSQDAYLFNASQLPIIGPKILATGYHPDRPTQETVDKAKKECKKERNIGKLLTLSANYGAGPGKIHQSLNLQGMELTFEEAQQLHQGFWKLYDGIRQYGRHLKQHAEANNMCVLNGMGRPVMREPNLVKDMVNAVGQSTGHDILMYYICILRDQMQIAGIDWKPVILDWHDQILVSVRTEDAELTQKIMQDWSMACLNDLLDGIIPMRGDADIVSNLAEAKL